MRHLSFLLACAVSSAISAYAGLWLYESATVEPAIIMPLKFEQSAERVLLWGGWRATEGDVAPGSNSVEIRCSRVGMTCSEAFATLLQHDDGMDVEAHAFSYQVTGWNDKQLEAVADGGLGLCTERRLIIDLVAKSAQLQWEPGPGCETDSGNAVLVGGPS